jgi:ribonucleoside-diphosphate reductase alpha chain
MTGTSYRRSAELAGIVGAYNGYARNASAHTRVMRKHQNATESAKSVATLDKDVWTEAIKQWSTGNSIGEKNGWRNAQTSVLAPTGTIGLMMDCDTTGIEPDLALVKFKKMVGADLCRSLTKQFHKHFANLVTQMRPTRQLLNTSQSMEISSMHQD